MSNPFTLIQGGGEMPNSREFRIEPQRGSNILHIAPKEGFNPRVRLVGIDQAVRYCGPGFDSDVTSDMRDFGDDEGLVDALDQTAKLLVDNIMILNILGVHTVKVAEPVVAHVPVFGIDGVPNDTALGLIVRSSVAHGPSLEDWMENNDPKLVNRVVGPLATSLTKYVDRTKNRPFLSDIYEPWQYVMDVRDEGVHPTLIAVDPIIKANTPYLTGEALASIREMDRRVEGEVVNLTKR